MLLYRYSNAPYTELKTKQVQGVMTPAMMAEEDRYVEFRQDSFADYQAISLLPDPIPLDIMGELYAGRNHHIWIPNHVIYEHVVESRRLPRFDYHISETPDDVKQMMADWPDNPTPAQKRAYFRAKSKRKWRTGENGTGNTALEINMGRYVGGTREAYLKAVPLFDESNWHQCAPMVPHVQINVDGGVMQLVRPARQVKIGPAKSKHASARW